jgi:hypothetical protein
MSQLSLEDIEKLAEELGSKVKTLEVLRMTIYP